MSDLPRLSEMHAETEQNLFDFFRLIWRSAPRLQILCRQNLASRTGSLPKMP